jgi:hypothetical protein
MEVFTYKPVDDSEHQDRVVFAEVLISHNSTCPRVLAACI